jgi:SAM-dependent methyltransferase
VGLTPEIEHSGYLHPGFAERYDRYRPRSPHALADVLLRLAGVDRARLVVDLGSGTGLSARMWSQRAESVVGVELNPAMLKVAWAETAEPNVQYLCASAYETGLADGCADVVTCGQSFHWMDPDAAIPEAARVLRPDGVFATHDFDLPPTLDWRLELAMIDVDERARRLLDERSAGLPRRPKAEHLERMRASGRFRYVKEILLHHIEEGDADRVVGFTASLGPVGKLLGEGVTEEELGLDRLRELLLGHRGAALVLRPVLTVRKRLAGAHARGVGWPRQVVPRPSFAVEKQGPRS